MTPMPTSKPIVAIIDWAGYHRDGDDWLRVNQFFMDKVAYVARKLDAVWTKWRCVRRPSVMPT
jgi:hypothetical protein